VQSVKSPKIPESFRAILARRVRKEGAGFDVPVAMGILGAMGLVKGLDRHLIAGELSLDGAIRPIRGTLSMAVCARAAGIPNLILLVENASEAAVVEGVSVYGVRQLAEIVALLNQSEQFSPVAANGNARPAAGSAAPDFRDVRGQAAASASRSRTDRSPSPAPV
jgi:magnesium chelatase family protein